MKQLEAARFTHLDEDFFSCFSRESPRPERQDANGRHRHTSACARRGVRAVTWTPRATATVPNIVPRG